METYVRTYENINKIMITTDATPGLWVGLVDHKEIYTHHREIFVCILTDIIINNDISKSVLFHVLVCCRLELEMLIATLS